MLDRSAYHRQWRHNKLAEDPESFRKAQTEKVRRWRADNPDKARAASIRANNSEVGKAGNKKWRENNQEKCRQTMRKSILKCRYNITLEQWDEMFAAQGSACANPGCKATEPAGRGWHTDHCHSTGKLRAILCKACNNALGMAKDSPSVLRGLAEYLEQHTRRFECL